MRNITIWKCRIDWWSQDTGEFNQLFSCLWSRTRKAEKPLMLKRDARESARSSWHPCLPHRAWVNGSRWLANGLIFLTASLANVSANPTSLTYSEILLCPGKKHKKKKGHEMKSGKELHPHPSLPIILYTSLVFIYIYKLSPSLSLHSPTLHISPSRHPSDAPRSWSKANPCGSESPESIKAKVRPVVALKFLTSHTHRRQEFTTRDKPTNQRFGTTSPDGIIPRGHEKISYSERNGESSKYHFCS